MSLLRTHTDDIVSRLEHKQQLDIQMQQTLLKQATEELNRLREQLRYENEERRKIHEKMLQTEYLLNKARNEPVRAAVT